MTPNKLAKIPLKYRKQVDANLKGFAKAVQMKREKIGLTQEQLAEEIGISINTLQFIEQGRRFPSLPNFFLLVTRLSIDLPCP